MNTSAQLLIGGWLILITAYAFSLDFVFYCISVQSFIGAMTCKLIEKNIKGGES